MPEQFNEGFTLNDIYKKPWTLGKPIGQGGFGLIYTANRGETKVKNPNDAEYVVKIEPKDNGPLFCETHFYVNCAKEDDLKKFMSSMGLKHLAMPRYISSGSCMYNEKEYRFLVMDRYTTDLQSILNKSSSHRINEIGVLCLMRQILNSLEYIHHRGYAHGDIKGANLMLKNDHESYLVDFGLAYRFMRDEKHQKFESKPERRHNGTIEYTSRDAHDGYQTYPRADLEILGYCVIHWLCGTLPWLDLIKNQEQVQQSKIKNMKNIKEFIKCTLGSVDDISDSIQNFIEFYLNEIVKLTFDNEPAYSKIQTKLNDTLRSIGHTNNTDNFGIFNPIKQNASKSSSAVQKKKATAAEACSSLNENGASSLVSVSFEDENDEINESPKAPPKGRRKAAQTKAKKQVIQEDSSESDDDESEKVVTKKPKTPVAKSKVKKNTNSEELLVEDTDDDSLVGRNRESKKSRMIPAAATPTPNKNLALSSAKSKSKIENTFEQQIQPKSPKPGIKSELVNQNGTRGPAVAASAAVASSLINEQNQRTPTRAKKPINYYDFDTQTEQELDEGRKLDGLVEEKQHVLKSSVKTLNNRIDKLSVKENHFSVKDEMLDEISPKLTMKHTDETPSKQSQQPQRKEKLNLAQIDALSKFKSANGIPITNTPNHHHHHQHTTGSGGGGSIGFNVPKSPLALSNLDNENGPILVKINRNVLKLSVATQTNDSYLARKRNLI